VFQLPQFLSAAQIPNPQSAIHTGGNEGLAARQKGDSYYLSTVPRKAAHFLARVCLPQMDQVVAFFAKVA
jgi:hypothetical protein